MSRLLARCLLASFLLVGLFGCSDNNNNNADAPVTTGDGSVVGADGGVRDGGVMDGGGADAH